MYFTFYVSVFKSCRNIVMKNEIILTANLLSLSEYSFFNCKGGFRPFHGTVEPVGSTFIPCSIDFGSVFHMVMM